MTVDEQQVTAKWLARHLVLPIAFGALLGFGLSHLPTPFDWIAPLGLAGFAVLWAAWQLVDVRHRIRRLDELRAEAEAHIASFDRHSRPRT